MAKPLVTDELWAAISPPMPLDPPCPKGGRPRVPGRPALTGILFGLATGSPWERLPVERGCGSGMTCWRPLARLAGVGHMGTAATFVLLDRLEAAGRIRWDRAVQGGSTVPARGGGRGDWPEALPDRGRPGT